MNSNPAAPSAGHEREYPPLPEAPILGTSRFGSIFRGHSDDAMRAYVDADRKERQLAACNFCLSQAAEARAATAGAHAPEDLINWVAERWHAEVASRPLVNVHRRSLDGAWRQMLRHLGVDDRARLGPTHDELLEHRQGEPDDLPLETGEGDAR